MSSRDEVRRSIFSVVVVAFDELPLVSVERRVGNDGLSLLYFVTGLRVRHAL